MAKRYRKPIMTDKLFRDFYLGFIRIHILYHARQTPVYGVELMQELGRHGYKVSPGTLYPILHELEEKGYLSSEKHVIKSKVRRYYSITSMGEQAQEETARRAAELIHEIHEAEK